MGEILALQGVGGVKEPHRIGRRRAKEGIMEDKNRDLKRRIEEERLKNKKLTTMEPLAVEPEEWQAFRKMAQPLENEHLELRVFLRDAEAALRANPEDEYLKTRVAYLKKRLEELEKNAPWISSDASWEYLLWGDVWGC